MNYKMKFMSGAELIISEELGKHILSLPELKGAIKSKELGGSINLSCVEYILPESVADKANENNPKFRKEIKCHDGSVAIYKFGEWIDQQSGAKLDLSYYPELKKGDSNQICLETSKELS